MITLNLNIMAYLKFQNRYFAELLQSTNTADCVLVSDSPVDFTDEQIADLRRFAKTHPDHAISKLRIEKEVYCVRIKNDTKFYVDILSTTMLDKLTLLVYWTDSFCETPEAAQECANFVRETFCINCEVVKRKYTSPLIINLER